MTDDILRELWQIKDRIAEENHYSLDTLVSAPRFKFGGTSLRDGKTETPGWVALEGKGAPDRAR
uniref:Uncharacterized protein n=1 Tax=Candidatus Kentrum sp. FW TaxID=2126338 RepID=A0A450U306_9GAMM|nr:MAG: hypothetical protein BECKFW1821C_GA0114237_11275 [Candidatus Kentron sp. FW]